MSNFSAVYYENNCKNMLCLSNMRYMLYYKEIPCLCQNLTSNIIFYGPHFIFCVPFHSYTPVNTYLYISRLYFLVIKFISKKLP